MTPRKRLNHETPYWITENCDYFVTICAEPRGRNHLCKETIGRAVLDAVRFYNENQRWFCSIVLLMPDHLHLIVGFPPDKILSKVVGRWKRGLAKSHGLSWQHNFFEHRLRNDENSQSKADYILHNPVRAGLVDDWQSGPMIGCRKLTDFSAACFRAKDTAAGTAAATTDFGTHTTF